MAVSEPRVVRVQEGETANFTVLRNGSADVTCTVQYATVDGKATAKEGDFVPTEKEETLIFEVGSREQSLSVYINKDGIPETDEPFYIILFNSTGKHAVLLWQICYLQFFPNIKYLCPVVVPAVLSCLLWLSMSKIICSTAFLRNEMNDIGVKTSCAIYILLCFLTFLSQYYKNGKFWYKDFKAMGLGPITALGIAYVSIA